MTAKPLRVSWSQIRAHGECKEKSFLLRSGHRSAAKDIRSYFHGMVVDRAMRLWLDDPNRTAGDMVTAVDDLIEGVAKDALESGDGVVRWKHANDRAELRTFCIELVKRLEPILQDRVLPYRFTTAERFAVPVRVPYLDGTPTTITLVGETDLTVYNDGWIVWDLKGTKDNTYYRKVLGQLFFYDLATLARHGEPTRLTGLIQPMCDEQVKEVHVSADNRREMFTRIQAFCTDVWRNEHPCKDSISGCAYCEVNHACPRFAPTGKRISLLATGLAQAAQEVRNG